MIVIGVVGGLMVGVMVELMVGLTIGKTRGLMVRVMGGVMIVELIVGRKSGWRGRGDVNIAPASALWGYIRVRGNASTKVRVGIGRDRGGVRVHVRGYGDGTTIGTSVGVEAWGKVRRSIGVHVGQEGARVKRDRGWTAAMKRVDGERMGCRRGCGIQGTLETAVDGWGLVAGKRIHMKETL
jgi:hypothetical protein